MMTQVDPLVLAAAADCASQKDCICDWSTLPKACLFKYCCGTLISGLGQTSPEYTNSLPSPADVISHSPPRPLHGAGPFAAEGSTLAVPQNANPDPWPPPSPALSLQRVEAFEQAQHLKAWCVPAPHWRVLGNAGNAAGALLTVLLHEPRFAASAVRAAYSRRFFLTRSHLGGRFVRRNSPTTRLHVRLRRFRTATIAGAHTCRRARR